MDNKLKYAILGLLISSFIGLNHANSDTITMSKGAFEGRVLENSEQVLVLETVAGEFVVIKKNQIKSLTKESEPDFYYRRGLFYEAQGEEEKSIINYIEALTLDPDHEKSRQKLQNIKYSKTKEKWDSGINKAETLLSKQEYKQALESYQSVLDMQPEDRLARQIILKMSDTHSQIAFLFYDHCADEEAIMELAKAEELNPNSAEIYYVLGRIHETDRKFDLARLEYERALEIDPNHGRSRSQLESLIIKYQKRYY